MILFNFLGKTKEDRIAILIFMTIILEKIMFFLLFLCKHWEIHKEKLLFRIQIFSTKNKL